MIIAGQVVVMKLYALIRNTIIHYYRFEKHLKNRTMRKIGANSTNNTLITKLLNSSNEHL